MTAGAGRPLEKLTLTVHGADTAAEQLVSVHDVYAEIYGVGRLAAGSGSPEVRVGWAEEVRCAELPPVIARSGSQVIGFAFGHGLGESTRWWEGRLDEFPEDVVTEWPERTFAIIEIAVRGEYRRRGVAKRLHTHLGAGLSEERITLLVRPANLAARAAYLNWGYHPVGRIRPFSDGPTFDTMIKQLSPG